MSSGLQDTFLQGESPPRKSIDSDVFIPFTPRQDEAPAANLAGLRKQQSGKVDLQGAVAEPKEEDHLAIQASIFKSLDGMLCLLACISMVIIQ